MRIDDLAYTAAERLAVVHLRIENCSVPERHRHMMLPEPMERFVYITKGDVQISLGETELCATSRDMIYLPRNTGYMSKWLEKSEFVVVDIALSDADGREISFGDRPSILFRDKFCIYDGLLRELADKTEDENPFNWLERTSLCLKLICEMARDAKQAEADGKYSRIKNAVTYIESNFTKDFYVEDLAKMAFLSPTSFRRLFFECKGMSPVDYRNTLRIGRSAELLKSGKYSVSEAAEEVGIRDVKYFGKLFSRYMGTTPGNFKKEMTKNNP
ncbi:MAG: helix-turn-helix transcriptional regulator [Clostridia bacterium]|nr:helix-turn-helix transcriptional regulator [Clostridia bacterium]